jgi:hypothetical protein
MASWRQSWIPDGLNAGNSHVMNALSGYDNIRNNVVDHHDRVVNDINKVKKNLSKKNINLDLL